MSPSKLWYILYTRIHVNVHNNYVHLHTYYICTTVYLSNSRCWPRWIHVYGLIQNKYRGPCHVLRFELIWIKKNFSSDFTNDLHLDFGEVSLGTTGTLYLHIRNESAIAAPYTVGVEHFIARPPTPPQEPLDRNMSTGQRRALLQKTPNLADPMAKTLNKAANGRKLFFC